MPDTPSLDATARAALRAKAEKARKGDPDGEVELWVSGEMAEFWAECTPERILALLAAARAHPEDTTNAR